MPQKVPPPPNELLERFTSHEPLRRVVSCILEASSGYGVDDPVYRSSRQLPPINSAEPILTMIWKSAVVRARAKNLTALQVTNVEGKHVTHGVADIARRLKTPRSHRATLLFRSISRPILLDDMRRREAPRSTVNKLKKHAPLLELRGIAWQKGDNQGVKIVNTAIQVTDEYNDQWPEWTPNISS